MSNPFQPGDKFIRYGKYGGSTIGEVLSVFNSYGVSLSNKITYIIPHIRSTNGVSYSLDGQDGRIYKIERQMTDEQVENYNRVLNEIKKRKIEKK